MEIPATFAMAGNPYGTFTLNMHERLPREQVGGVPSPGWPQFWASLG